MTSTTTTAEPTLDPRAERRNRYHEADVVIVGAGVFGCAAAYALGNQGRSVLLLEKKMREPDRIVGELMQPGGIAALRKIGLADCIEGIDAQPCYGYEVRWNGQPVTIPYAPLDDQGRVIFGMSRDGTAAPPVAVEGKHNQGRSFHHGRFIMNMRRACLAQENVTVVETEVTGAVTGEDSGQVLGVKARTADPETGKTRPDYYFGQLTIAADGYMSKFRKQLITQKPVSRSKFFALELIDAPLPNPGFGHVVIGSKNFPVLMYQIGTRETRALIDVPDKLPEASPAAGGVRGYIQNCVLPNVPQQLQPAFAAALANGPALRSMPNSWLPPSRQPNTPGILLLGDAMNMRHPLTGSGMTVALNDVIIMTDLLGPDRIPDLGDAAAVRAAMTTWHWRRKSLTSILNVLAQALYALFAADDRLLRALQVGCFDYFQRGLAEEPVTLLGGMIQEPSRLAYHFFSVAFLAIWLNALQIMGGGVFGIFKVPIALVDGILILWKASIVFLPVFWRELR